MRFLFCHEKIKIIISNFTLEFESAKNNSYNGRKLVMPSSITRKSFIISTKKPTKNCKAI